MGHGCGGWVWWVVGKWVLVGACWVSGCGWGHGVQLGGGEAWWVSAMGRVKGLVGWGWRWVWLVVGVLDGCGRCWVVVVGMVGGGYGCGGCVRVWWIVVIEWWAWW